MCVGIYKTIKFLSLNCRYSVKIFIVSVDPTGGHTVLNRTTINFVRTIFGVLYRRLGTDTYITILLCIIFIL